MDGLRKVVKLRIFDIPDDNLKVDKNNYQYNWKNKYFIGKFELHRTKQYRSENNEDKYNDNYLDKMINKIVLNDNNIEDNLFVDDDYLIYDGKESSIYYYGNNVDDIKKKIYKK